MIIYPALALRRGRVVRSIPGDPSSETIERDNPVKIARLWLEQGAEWLHVVNLDGPLGEEASAGNRQALASLLTLGMPIQFAGGLRTLANIATVLHMGVK